MMAEGDIRNLEPTDEEIAKYAVEENLVATMTTNGAGYAALNLSDEGYTTGGIFLITEESSEKVKESVRPFYVILPTTIDGEVVTVLDIYPKNVPEDDDEPYITPVIPDEPEPETKAKITILKHEEGDESVVLSGAEFQLYRLAETDEEKSNASAKTIDYNGQTITLIPVMDGEDPIVITTDENGLAKTPDLPYGLYFLYETKAPDGYNLIEGAIPVFSTATSEQYPVAIANAPGFILPETGGAGTAAFTVSGLILCMAAAVLLIRRKLLSA